MKPSEFNIKGPLQPIFTHTFTDLIGERPSNCSMLPFKESLVLAYRSGWEGSRIRVCKVHNFEDVSDDHELNLSHPMATAGQEDPRLFIHDGSLWVAFTGVRVTVEKETIARFLLARLNDDLEVTEVFEPNYLWTTQWEKNWQMFSHGSGLYCIYSMFPWRSLLVDTKTHEVHRIAWADGGMKWPFGHCRGGSSPVQVGPEFYCFFHGAYLDDYQDGTGKAVYTMGVLTFDARQPYLPRRYTTEPILWPSEDDVYVDPTTGEWHAITVYPGGAYLDGDEWIVSYGHNDCEPRVSAFSFADIEARLDGRF